MNSLTQFTTRIRYGIYALLILAGALPFTRDAARREASSRGV